MCETIVVRVAITGSDKSSGMALGVPGDGGKMSLLDKGKRSRT